MNKRNNPETQQINSHSVEQRTHSSREKVTMSNDDSDNETEIKTTETTSPQKDEPSLEIKKDSTEASAEPEKPSSDDEDSKIEALNEAKAKEDAEKTAKEAEEERKRKDELRKKYANWPLRAIKDPHDNDVMYGRGGGTNHHHGNKTYRKLVENRKLEYVNSKRLDKPLVALEIIRLWRAQLPPGRFLKLDEKTGLWNDVGDKKAREKTSQALREKAPLIRKQQEEEKGIEDGEKSAEKYNGKSEGETKSTRFAAGTKEPSSGKATKPVLARDHSLGREYLESGESVSLDGFSWQDPFHGDSAKRSSSYSNSSSPSRTVPPHAPGAYPPAGRMSSNGSLGIAPPHHGHSPGHPPPPDYYGNTSRDRSRQYSSGRYESWGEAWVAPFPYPPPPPLPAVHGPAHQRSGSWSHVPIPPPPQGSSHHQRSDSWNGREHSLSFNPLIGASVSRPADRTMFGDRNSFPGRPSSGYWAGPYRSPPRHHPSPTNSTPSPNSSYNVGMDIARTWSGGTEGGGRTWSMEPPQSQPYGGQPQPIPGADSSPIRDTDSPGTFPRPQIVKRDTSHQNETVETKHKVKRAAFNRDNSLASNTLKQQYMPEYFSDVKKLSDSFGKSTLDSAIRKEQATTKPNALNETNRVTTIDIITSELLAKPELLSDTNRVSTIDALDLDLEVDPIIDQNDIEFDNPMERELKLNDINESEKRNLPKPNTMIAENRITTSDFLEIVNSPVEPDVGDDTLQFEKTDDSPPPLNQEAAAASWLI